MVNPLPPTQEIVGIIPAAGDATRWQHRIFKELLPMPSGYCGLIHTAQAMIAAGATQLFVIGNKTKVGAIQAIMQVNDLPIPWYYIGQADRTHDMWGAIELSFNIKAHVYLFGMPDTYYPLNTFLKFSPHNTFNLGVFFTHNPGRYGAFLPSDPTHIRDKVQNFYPDKPVEAWGTASWTWELADFWANSTPYQHYSQAFNAAIDAFGVDAHLMDYYYDLATYVDYRELLTHDYNLHARTTVRE